MKKIRTKNSSKQKHTPASKKTAVKILPKTPKVYLTVNKKVYRAINPEKALTIAKKLNNGIGRYKVHVIYGREQISKRKIESIENIGKYTNARDARIAIEAFLDRTLWR